MPPKKKSKSTAVKAAPKKRQPSTSLPSPTSGTKKPKVAKASPPAKRASTNDTRMGLLTAEGMAKFFSRRPPHDPSDPETRVSEPHVDMPDAVMMSSEASSSSTVRPNASDVSAPHAFDHAMLDCAARDDIPPQQTDAQETPETLDTLDAVTHISEPHEANPDVMLHSSGTVAPATSDVSAAQTLDLGLVGPRDDAVMSAAVTVSSEASSTAPDASDAVAPQAPEVLDPWLVDRQGRLEVLRGTLFTWPEDMLRSVASLASTPSAEYAEYLETILNSMSVSTSFSGVDSPSTALAMMGAAALTLQGREVTKDSVPKVCNKFGIEWLPQSQQELRRHPYGPNCIFSDINGFWLPTLADKLDTISRERRVMTILKDLVESSVCTGRVAYCEKCSRNCKVSEADLHIGGTPCVDFSSRGQQDQLGGRTTTSLLAFVAMRREVQEPYFVQENVPSFPDEFLSSMLSDLYELQSCVIDPECTFGWPVSRRRKYVVGRHKTQTVPWHMRLDDFIRAISCGAKVAADGTLPLWDIFFVASGDELRSELLWARKGGVTVVVGCEATIGAVRYDVAELGIAEVLLNFSPAEFGRA
ncbi:unnamed protein product [Symbiodinium microadriaticum]|nr:unnamed protein product [Symbiodinium microadriaticum]